MTDTPDTKVPAIVGIDYGANGTYVYENVPVGETAKQTCITRMKRDLWHVGEDASGNWLYRMRPRA
jgi:hypothetical protein